MPYDPNELLKLKHLTEFARQFRIKLDGETDPKPQRTVRIALNGTNYATSDNIREPTSVITGSAGDFRININVRFDQTPNFQSTAIIPTFSFANVSNGVTLTQRQASLWGATASWVFNISAKTACTFDLTVKLIAADGFDAYEHTYHVELYEE